MAAPDTFAGAILNAAGNAAATGNAVITGYQATASLPIPAAGQTGIDFVSAADATAAPGYAFVIDTAASASTISGAADRFEAVSGAAAGMTYYGGSGGFGDIALTDGTNSVVGASDAGNYFVGAQGGNNAIYAGNGDDTIATSSYPATPFVDPSDYTPSPTIGTNLIGLGSGANVVIADANDTIVGSTGNDTVYATGDASQVFAGSKGITYVAGAYVLGAVYTGAAGGTVYGGNGSVVNVIGSGGVLIASAGNETLQSALSLGQLLTHSASIAGGQVGSTFFAGSGSDNLAGSGSRDLFYAGTGTATIDGGGGADIVAFVNGAAGGADTVAFTNQDHVSLVGYGSAAVSQAIASSATIAGGVRFSLPDNTLVTLTGATSLTVSDFT